MNKGKIKKECGITLIALIITIIVLLILAGVSISMVVGDNGILTQAVNAAEATTISEEKEQIQLAYVSALTKNDSVGESELQGELDRSVGENKTEVTGNPDNTLLVLYNDTAHYYEVDDGVVTEIDAETIASRNYYISNSSGVTYYSTLADAYSGAESGETIYVYKNVSDDSELTVTSDKEITIDLNGKTVTRSVTTTVSNSGVLTITDTSEDGDGVYTTGENEVNTIYMNSGTFNLYGGTIEANSESIKCSPVWIYRGYMNMYGGSVVSTCCGVYLYDSAMNSSSISGYLYLYDGTIYGGKYGIYAMRGLPACYKYVYVHGGFVQGGDYGIYVSRGVSCNIYSGCVCGDTAIVGDASATSTASIRIGSSSVELNNSEPVLIGSAYGVLRLSTGINVYFYNGIVKSINEIFGSDVIVDCLSSVRSGYEIAYGTEEIDGVTYNTAYLEPSE